MPEESDEVWDGFDVSQRRRYCAICEVPVQYAGTNDVQVNYPSNCNSQPQENRCRVLPVYVRNNIVNTAMCISLGQLTSLFFYINEIK